MMKHTPGPWTIFVCDGISSVMPAMRPGDICTGVKNDDDARLIAAAPELLAACKDIESKIVDCEAGLINWRPDDFLHRVRAAIAAAGEG
jgi:hypothetical protein